MTAAEELRRWRWERCWQAPISFKAARLIIGVRFPEPTCWVYIDDTQRAEIMSEAIEAAEALGL